MFASKVVSVRSLQRQCYRCSRRKSGDRHDGCVALRCADMEPLAGIVEKGDQHAITAVPNRLKDFHADVRYTAMETSVKLVRRATDLLSVQCPIVFETGDSE